MNSLGRRCERCARCWARSTRTRLSSASPSSRCLSFGSRMACRVRAGGSLEALRRTVTRACGRGPERSGWCKSSRPRRSTIGGSEAKRAAMAELRNFTVSEEDDGIRLDRWFKRHLPDISFNIVSRWARTGQLRLDGKRAAPGDRVQAGQQIRVPPPETAPARSARPQRRVEPLAPEEAELVREMVIYSDAHAFVLAKPPGLATQGGTKTHHHLDRLLDGLADEAGARPKLVHRLDKDTSGALLVARTARAAGHFAKSFSARTARKVYWALVVGVPSPDDGLIDLPLAKQPGTGGEKMHVSEEAGLPAKTSWRLIDRAGHRAAWLELLPLI